ncbi:hypothetical protein C2G38_2235564 [Gigaspora rosea]|uniref:Uncharacterized protein n=1 Tax=Gigaspora rosea TaxID=44941 RepID=A0A397TPK7_9GLOM|nr:hypothetical protein C2G38_2235564 [Gigaspora rosea]
MTIFMNFKMHPDECFDFEDFATIKKNELVSIIEHGDLQLDETIPANLGKKFVMIYHKIYVFKSTSSIDDSSTS